jgi:hypothetical protein
LEVNVSIFRAKKKNSESASYVLHARFLLGLFFDPEDGGDMYL